MFELNKWYRIIYKMDNNGKEFTTFSICRNTVNNPDCISEKIKSLGNSFVKVAACNGMNNDLLNHVLGGY